MGLISPAAGELDEQRAVGTVQGGNLNCLRSYSGVVFDAWSSAVRDRFEYHHSEGRLVLPFVDNRSDQGHDGMTRFFETDQ